MRLSQRRRLAPDTVLHPEHRKLHSPHRNNAPANTLAWLRREGKSRIAAQRRQKQARKRNRGTA